MDNPPSRGFHARMADVKDAVAAPGIAALFARFLLLGLSGFGGVLPLAHRMLVEDTRWLTMDEFTELLGLCQFLPGGTIINLSVAVGMRFRGAGGAVVSIVGLVTAPAVIVVALGIVYGRFSQDAVLRHGFAGLAAAACGLLAAMAVRIVRPLRRRPLAAVLALVCFGAVALLRAPLLPTMFILAPLSMALLGRRRA